MAGPVWQLLAVTLGRDDTVDDVEGTVCIILVAYSLKGVGFLFVSCLRYLLVYLAGPIKYNQPLTESATTR